LRTGTGITINAYVKKRAAAAAAATTTTTTTTTKLTFNRASAI